MSNFSDGGKGDIPRKVDRTMFENNWQEIFGRQITDRVPKTVEVVDEEVEPFFFVNRLEVVKDGRLLTQYLELGEKLELSYQDGGRTLKVFINKR